MKKGYVYIRTNKPRGVLYIGVTSQLLTRSEQHLISEADSFVKRYNLKRLVYLEEYPTIIEAIQREKQLKRWHREWKINLIEKDNPDWEDLFGRS
ncbi:GIY-YIG nuclease family protein [Patescibacteria group bacterium]|nr:GIY-YIG nuclease family protein [Patescibacteria group bacterium]